MAEALPPFPRIPHLAPSPAASRADRVLDAASRRRFLTEPVLVEEKLDGANVSLAWREGTWRVGTRGGEDTLDRGAVRPRLRDWAWRHHDALRAALASGDTLYGEWLATPHALVYDALPDDLVVLDIRRADGAFLRADDRDARSQGAGLTCPPRRFRGVLHTLDAVAALAGTSAFGRVPMEGVVLRLEDDTQLLARAKWVRPDFVATPPRP